MWGFIGRPAGYLMEKADAETGFVYPIPDEARALRLPGGAAALRRVLPDRRRRRARTFVDGYIVNATLDACYRSMKSGRWEPVELDPEIVG